MPNSNAKFQVTRLELPQRALNRRQFIYSTAIAAAAFAARGQALPAAKVKSPNERLDLGIIGCTGKGAEDSVMLSRTENIVALCDVDANALAYAHQHWPQARLYKDYRVMLDKEKSIDATTVSIPDHQHAPAAMLAMQAGKGVYCQKPLAHTMSEARAMAKAAAQYNVPTQMGNQGHSSEDIRRLCEMIWSGAIGPIREAHCWTNRPIWAQGGKRPPGSDPVPTTLDWNLWLGPAPERPYLTDWPLNPDGTRVAPLNSYGGGHIYCPTSWRGWWEFGSGALGDMACHVMDGAYWALKLGFPTKVELVDSSPLQKEMAPLWSIIRYHFPARGDMPPCTVTWYDGGKLPPKPPEMEARGFGSSGTIFIGEKGKIMSGEYTDRPRLLPESSMMDYKWPAQTIPRVPNNDPYLDFARGCKGGPLPCSNFTVSGPFTEMIIIGNLVLRLGKSIDWDAANLRATNAPEAEELIKGHYRDGWKV